MPELPQTIADERLFDDLMAVYRLYDGDKVTRDTAVRIVAALVNYHLAGIAIDNLTGHIGQGSPIP